MKIAELVPTWIAESTLRKSTLKRYVYSLGKLVRSGITDVEGISRASFRRYAQAERARGVGPATCNRDLATLSSFCRWLWEHERFPLPVLLELRELYQEHETRLPVYLTPAEYLALRAHARDVRNTLDLAVLLAVGTGVRLGELRHLRHEDFVYQSPEGPFLRIARKHEIKTRRPRTVPLRGALVRELLERWDFGAGRTGPVFSARRAELRHAGTLRDWLLEARRRAGIYVNWIILRHTFATWHVQEGTSIALVASWLGHSVGVCYTHYVAFAPGGNSRIEAGFRGLAAAEGSAGESTTDRGV